MYLRKNIPHLSFGFVCTLVLAACQNPAPTDTAEVPDPFLGTWDENAAACSQSFSMTRFTVSPIEIYWFGGRGEVTGVSGDDSRIEVDLAYIAEGSPLGEPEPLATMLSLDDADQLSLGLGGGREGLVRCDEANVSS